MKAAYSHEEVWKFPLGPPGGPIVAAGCEVLIPDGFRICHVGELAGRICVWAIVDPTRTPRRTKVRVVSSGQPIGVDGFGHIGTVVLGQFVWHVFMDGR